MDGEDMMPTEDMDGEALMPGDPGYDAAECRADMMHDMQKEGDA